MIQKNMRMAKKGALAILFAVCLFFSVSIRSGDKLSFEQHLLAAGMDHYYLLYAMLPITLYSLFSYIQDDSEMVIGRYKNYFIYFSYKWLSLGVICGCIALAQTFAILISAIGLPLQNNWIITVNSLSQELFYKISISFTTPLSAFVAAIIFQWIGSWFLCGILMWICHFGGIKATIGLLIPFYAYSALWIKIPFLQLLPVTGMNHLLILHHNLGQQNRFVLTAVASAIICIIMIITTKFYWKRTIHIYKRQRRGLLLFQLRMLFSKNNIIGILLITLLLAVYKLLLGQDTQDMAEWVLMAFEGHGLACFMPLKFIEMLIVNGAPLYFIACFLEQTINRQSIFVIVRSRKKRKLLISKLCAITLFLLVYIILLGIMVAVSGYGVGHYFATKSEWMLLIQLLLLKMLDCSVQSLFLILIHEITEKTVAGFVFILIGNMFCMLPENISKFVPFGISCSARFLSVSYTISFICMLILLISLVICNKKKEFK